MLSGESRVGDDKTPDTEPVDINVNPVLLGDLKLSRDCDGLSRSGANRVRLPPVIRDIGGGGNGKSSPDVMSTRSWGGTRLLQSSVGLQPYHSFHEFWKQQAYKTKSMLNNDLIILRPYRECSQPLVQKVIAM